MKHSLVKFSVDGTYKVERRGLPRREALEVKDELNKKLWAGKTFRLFYPHYDAYDCYAVVEDALAVQLYEGGLTK